jgi:hypothetical protein
MASRKSASAKPGARKSGSRARKSNVSPKQREQLENDAFVAALVASGEAARPNADGSLPAGATHELVETKKGELKAIRRRFSVS